MIGDQFKNAEAEHLTPSDRPDFNCPNCNIAMTLESVDLRECLFCSQCCDEDHTGRCGK